MSERDDKILVKEIQLDKPIRKIDL